MADARDGETGEWSDRRRTAGMGVGSGVTRVRT